MWLWELNSGPLEEQVMLLISEPSLQSLVHFFKGPESQVGATDALLLIGFFEWPVISMLILE